MKRMMLLCLLGCVVFMSCQSSPKPQVKSQSEIPQPAVAPVPAATQVPAQTASVPAAPAAETPWKIIAKGNGFSPKADYPNNEISFQIQGPVNASLKSWKIEIVDGQGNVIRDLSTASILPPPSVLWDGYDSQRRLPSDGNYTARLTEDSGSAPGSVVSSSEPFFLDITPPKGTVQIQPLPFNPSVVDSKVTFMLALKDGAASIANWRLFVYDPKGSKFKDFLSEESKNNVLVWDGRSPSNGVLESGTTYTVTVQIFDIYGNEGKIDVPFQVAVYGVKSGPVETIRVSDLYFKAYTDDFTDVPADRLKHNQEILQQLVAIFKADAKRPIKIIGHANKVFWNNDEKGEIEQREVLVPLSQKRAEAIKNELVKLGFTDVEFVLEGVGATDPAVPFSDTINNWKNRRVEFIFDFKDGNP